MGQGLPVTANPAVHCEPRDFFEAKYVQRIKDTPFIDAQIYSSNPLLFMDPVGPSLLQLVSPRLGTQQLFPQHEVLNLMNCVISGLLQLEQRGYEGHGDICLQTIAYSAKEKVFRLSHPAFNEESAYLLAKHGKRFSTLAPEQLSSLEEESEAKEVSLKADVFALGILLCEACTLTPSSDIYCPDTYSIFHLEIQKRLQLIEDFYSPFVVRFLEMCLEYDPESRPSPSELARFLQQAPSIPS